MPKQKGARGFPGQRGPIELRTYNQEGGSATGRAAAMQRLVNEFETRRGKPLHREVRDRVLQTLSTRSGTREQLEGWLHGMTLKSRNAEPLTSSEIGYIARKCLERAAAIASRVRNERGELPRPD